MANVPSNVSKPSTIGAALNAVSATSGKGKMSDAERAKAATERATKVLHAELSDAQYSVAVSICTVAATHKTSTATWQNEIAALVARMYSDADKPMLLHAVKGLRHVNAVGKAIATVSGTSWARTQYRAGVHKFLFGDDKTKKLPGARRTKKLAAADVARFVLASRDKIAEYVKRMDRQDIDAASLKRVTEALGAISNAVSVIRKACGK